MPNGSFDRLMTLSEIEGPISVRPAVLLKAAFSKTAKMNSRPVVWNSSDPIVVLDLEPFFNFKMASRKLRPKIKIERSLHFNLV